MKNISVHILENQVNIYNCQKIYFIDFAIHSNKEILCNIKKLKINDGIVFRNNMVQNLQEIQTLCKRKKIIIFSDFRNKFWGNIQHLASSNKILHYNRHIKKSISFHQSYDLKRIHNLQPAYIFISPVFLTQTHLEVKPLGTIKVIKFCNVIKEIKPEVRIFLLGGMNAKRFYGIKKMDFQNLIQGYAGIRNIND